MKISKITEQQESYSFTSFYAEVGGFVGLLLGISVHQVSLIFDYILKFLIHNLKKTIYQIAVLAKMLYIFNNAPS
jgi:hypothetical protein